jgi:hypothetical protein
VLFFSKPSGRITYRASSIRFIVKGAEQYAHDKKKYPSFGKYVASMNRNVLVYRNSGSSRVSIIQIRNNIGNFNILKFV